MWWVCTLWGVLVDDGYLVAIGWCFLEWLFYCLCWLSWVVCLMDFCAVICGVWFIVRVCCVFVMMLCLDCGVVEWLVYYWSCGIVLDVCCFGWLFVCACFVFRCLVKVVLFNLEVAYWFVGLFGGVGVCFSCVGLVVGFWNVWWFGLLVLCVGRIFVFCVNNWWVYRGWVKLVVLAEFRWKFVGLLVFDWMGFV